MASAPCETSLQGRIQDAQRQAPAGIHVFEVPHAVQSEGRPLPPKQQLTWLEPGKAKSVPMRLPVDLYQAQEQQLLHSRLKPSQPCFQATALPSTKTWTKATEGSAT
eukprot:CAMPEP_0197682078 /NCGR_PEP_ID=MMETSP1338-20131121/95940_1 /TAXON_ID=43686 ORGANISM="Pelagodinium beii, Strain RCC1491" /NCGR_SAMPLE_ID=MMETSP1338 /ASSEMBLY_ACC=CAM_ASM_000754 /LENGTH=106 /DNA_ID=CAMNT_0043263503 /DNA_START=214 /DNA_END=535 /DNA_ORIENTATION=-